MSALVSHINYSIKEIIQKKNSGTHTPQMDFLYEAIECYKTDTEKRIEDIMDILQKANPENSMRWVYEHVEDNIRPYVIMNIRGQKYNVLMKQSGKWKTISDIGVQVEELPRKEMSYKDWKCIWTDSIEKMNNYNLPFFETHAHYNLDVYDRVRSLLLQDLFRAGVKKCIIPAIEYNSNYKIKECFDSEEYNFIKYAFGSHPKYIGKEDWTEKRWSEFSSLLDDPKCIALGEVGLDYSYVTFHEEERKKQMKLFDMFIDKANENKLPMILHIRPADDISCAFDVNEDAFCILKKNKIKYGAVLHCFGGSLSDMQKYFDLGVTYFGIGGRINSHGSEQLNNAILHMPETSILLETDAPYMKFKKGKVPNTSFALIDIAEKIAQIRGTSVEHIIELSYENASRFFSVE